MGNAAGTSIVIGVADIVEACDTLAAITVARPSRRRVVLRDDGQVIAWQ
jgi:hypothetical protein